MAVDATSLAIVRGGYCVVNIRDHHLRRDEILLVLLATRRCIGLGYALLRSQRILPGARRDPLPRVLTRSDGAGHRLRLLGVQRNPEYVGRLPGYPRRQGGCARWW